MGEAGGAVKAYREAIKIDPMNPLLFDVRAEPNEMLGERGLVLQGLDTPIALSPNYPACDTRRGIALLSRRRLDEDIRDFDQVIDSYEESIKRQIVSRRNLVEAAKFESRHARAYNNRGSAYYQSCRINRAIEDYDRDT